MKRFLATLCFCIFIRGETIPQPHGAVPVSPSATIENVTHDEAINSLIALREDDEAKFIRTDQDYLLARLAEADGRLGLAMVNYKSVADRNSPLRIYALKHISQIARSTGNLMLERIYLDEIQSASANSLLDNTARLRSAQNAFERQNYSEAIEILQSGTSSASVSGKAAKVAGSRENRALLARALMFAGRQNEARAIFSKLIAEAPNAGQPDDVSLAAVRGSDLMDGRAENANASAISVSEHLRRARIYQFDREFADAKLHFESAVAAAPNGPETAEAILQIGRGFAMQGDYQQAVGWFDRVSAQFSQSDADKDALLQAGSAYARMGKPDEGIQRYQTYIDKYPSGEKLDRAYLNIVDILRDQGNSSDALTWCEKARSAFKGKAPEAVALFTEARIHLANEDWPAALTALEGLASFTDLGGGLVPGGTDRDEVNYLRAFCLEQLGRFPEAIDQYLAIPDGRNKYFGWRSTQRLEMLASRTDAGSLLVQRSDGLAAALDNDNPDQKRKDAQALLRVARTPEQRDRALAALRDATSKLPGYLIPEFQIDQTFDLPASDPHANIATELVKLGLYDEAAPEFAAAMRDAMDAADERAFTLATYFKRGDRAEPGLDLLEQIWRKIPADYPIELMPRDQLELLYPAPFKASLLKYAPQRGVDPRFMLAIMRQESRFQPDAKSYAAARGLMQFIATTANKIGGELGRDAFEQDDLYDPATAILFGSQYLGDLFALFPDEPEAVAASYNGGEDNMQRWLARSRSDAAERYVSEIVYSQSKDYVYKIMTNYRMYQYLYDRDLNLRN